MKGSKVLQALWSSNSHPVLETLIPERNWSARAWSVLQLPVGKAQGSSVARLTFKVVVDV